MIDPAGDRARSRLAPGADRIAGLLCVLAVVPLASAAVTLSLQKYYAIDELMHAHAAWLTGHGAVPYRDFFDFHLPLLYQLFGGLWRFLADEPGNVIVLRIAMLPFVAAIAAGLAFLNRRRGPVPCLAVPALLLSTSPFVVRATEIRHDTIAFALLVGVLAILSSERGSPRARGAAAGVCLALSVWGSQKVLMYGAPVGVLLLVDLVRARRGRASTFGSPLAALAGASAVGVAAVVWLVATRSMDAFVKLCFGWAFRWQADYPAFPWRQSFTPVQDEFVWVLVLAALGVVATWARPRRDPGERTRDLLLTSTLLSSFLFFVYLKAPYDYNLIPFLGMTALFAARGVGTIASAGVKGAAAIRAPATLGTTLAVVVGLLPPLLSLRRLEQWARSDNRYQHAVLSQIAALTSPSDAAYDNSGSYVARPSASYFMYTDAPVRTRLAGVLSQRIPRDILASGCVLFLYDARTEGLPDDLRRFLDDHFQPWSGDLRLWGQRYSTDGSGRLAAQFLAPRKDRYFVDPPSLLERASLAIDGRRVTTTTFELDRGAHTLVCENAEPGVDVRVLWLPRNGETWTPHPEQPPRFSRIL